MNRFFFVLLAVLFGAYFFLSSPLRASESLLYPIEQMSKLECRFQDFSSLSSDCKMSLPILHTSDYTKYKNDYSLYRRVYTILWGSTYNYGWDIGNGGHSGVDIATSKGTPVVAIASGKVVTAGSLYGRGNVIKVEHTINGRKVYAVYAHLSAINVTKGDQVLPSQKLGEVGSTGNSTGNHLHFQIDLAVSGSGPRYRSNCRIKNYDEIVNSNVCFDQLNTNTIDPLLFLESNGAIVHTTQIQKPQIQPISQTGLRSRKDIEKQEIEEFLSKYTVDVKLLNFGNNVELGKQGMFQISVIEKRNNKPFSGSFPGKMHFQYDATKMKIFPEGILQLEQGKRGFEVTPKVRGNLSFEILIGEVSFQKVSFGVYDPKKSYTPSRVLIQLDKKVYQGQAGKGIAYFQDASKMRLLGISFTGTYTLASPDEHTFFCLKHATNAKDLALGYRTDCSETDYVKVLSFTYKDTLSGVLIFGYKVSKVGNNQLRVLSPSGTSMGITGIVGQRPIDLDMKHPYSADMFALLDLGIPTGMRIGYLMPDRELSREDGILMILNVLEYQSNSCTDAICRASLDARKRNLLAENADRYTSLTRLEMLYLVNRYVVLSPASPSPTKFRDVKPEDLPKVQAVMRDQTWKDSFGGTGYFQPNKKITRAEGMYLLRLAFGKQ